MERTPGGIRGNTGKSGLVNLPENEAGSEERIKSDKVSSRTDSGRKVENTSSTDKDFDALAESRHGGKKKETPLSRRSATSASSETVQEEEKTPLNNQEKPAWETFDSDDSVSLFSNPEFDDLEDGEKPESYEVGLSKLFDENGEVGEFERSPWVNDKIADIARQLHEGKTSTNVEEIEIKNSFLINQIKEMRDAEFERLKKINEKNHEKHHNKIQQILIQQEQAKPEDKQHYDTMIKSMEEVIASDEEKLNSLLKSLDGKFQKHIDDLESRSVYRRHRKLNEERSSLARAQPDLGDYARDHKALLYEPIQELQAEIENNRKLLSQFNLNAKTLTPEQKVEKKQLKANIKKCKKKIAELEKSFDALGSKIDDLARTGELKWNPSQIYQNAVYSAENMPFAIDPKGVQHYGSESPLFAPEPEEYVSSSDSAPLLAEKEHLQDEFGNLLYQPKTDAKSLQEQSILDDRLEKEWLIGRELSEKGELSEEFLDSIDVPKTDKSGDEIPIDVRRQVALDQRSVKPYKELATYRPDTSKPLYGFSANEDSGLVNKKKLRKYKNSVRIAREVKAFFKKTGLRLRDEFRKFMEKRNFGKRLQRTMEAIAREPGNIFHSDMKNREFVDLFKGIYLKKYKKNVEGLQRFHDLMGVTLSGKVGFTQNERDGGYENAMTTLLLVGAGLVDGKDGEGEDTFNYHGLDSPAERKAGVRLAAEATPLKRDEVLQLAKKGEKKVSAHIKPSHLLRASRLLVDAVKAKQEVESANALAIKEGRLNDLQDADEAAKQKLIDLVVGQAGTKLPEDVRNKLEVMRGNYAWAMTDMDEQEKPEPVRKDFSKDQMIPSEARIREVEKSVENTEWDDEELVPQLEKELNVLKKIRDRQFLKLAQARQSINSELGQTKVITPATRQLITQAILAHCGMLVVGSPEKSRDIESYDMTRVKIEKHQRQAANALAKEIAGYIDSGNATASGVYKLLTKSPPLSAFVNAGEYTQNTPPHFLHGTALKSGLEEAFARENLAQGDEGSASDRFSLDDLNQASASILSKSGRLLDETGQVNQELLSLLTTNILVGSGAAKLESTGKAVDAGILSMESDNGLTVQQVKKTRKLSHALVTLMNKEKVTAAEIARKIHPADKKARKQLSGLLNTMWVK